MSSKIIIEPHMSVEDLNTHIRKFESDCKTANRLQVIKQVMKTNNIEKTSEIMDVSPRTVYEWVKKWNNGGIDGLRHKKGAGRPPFLSKEQFKELDGWMLEQEYLTTKDLYLHIKDNYEIDYSTKQVRRIVRKLDYTWVKPYPIADNQPDDAEEQLKEKIEDLNPENDIFGFVDETAIQNKPNVGKIIKKKDQKLK